jgi:hypothetical protein
MATKEAESQKTIPQKINDLKGQIVANSKDAEWAKKMLSELTSLQKQNDVESVELIVPTKDVIETYKLGESLDVIKTKKGFLVKTKSLDYAFYSGIGSGGVYAMINNYCQILEQYDSLSEEEKDTASQFLTAISVIMQTPIFASISDLALFKIANNCIEVANEEGQRILEEATKFEETEDDHKKNAEFDNLRKAGDVITADL